MLKRVSCLYLYWHASLEGHLLDRIPVFLPANDSESTLPISPTNLAKERGVAKERSIQGFIQNF